MSVLSCSQSFRSTGHGLEALERLRVFFFGADAFTRPQGYLLQNAF